MTMTTQSTLEPDTDHLHEEPARGGFVRGLIRILAMSLAVTVVIAGLYIAFAGMPGSDGTSATAATGPAEPSGAAPSGDDTAGEKAANEKGGAADKPPADPPTFTETYRAAAADLPEGRLSDKEKEKALKGYLGAHLPSLTSASKPAEAAVQACELLADGTKPKELIQGISDEGAFTKQQSKAFLLGATTLYCSDEARAFR